jgi:serine-type D-Ala-D-Ala carboxypeptidase
MASVTQRDFLALSTELDRLFAGALLEKTFSGASLLIASPSGALLQKEWGHTRSGGAPVTRDTLFDLASLTKPLATTALCMWAVSQSKISLDDRLSRFYPSHHLSPEKRVITIRHLLNHCSGFTPYVPFYQQLIRIPSSERPAVILSSIFKTPLIAKPGEVCHYSDLGFIVLGMILETVLDATLDRLATDTLFHPNHIEPISFHRLTVKTSDPSVVSDDLPAAGRECAATEQCPWRNRLLIGEVHDENAYCLGGVAGHAGLFGTARSILSLLSFLWDTRNGKVYNPEWSADVVGCFWQRQEMVPGSTWALGFDTPSSENSSAGEHFSPHSVGHLGFTGTSFWMDLEQEVLVVLLTNRVYPSRNNEKLKAFRPKLHNLIMESLHDLS